jgi:molybdopterin-guanine dinucleotide biosynthesis protein
MATIVIGGHSRDVGKTSVVAGLIAALREQNWTAVKITQFGHGICSVSTEPCDCALNETEHSWSLDEELDRSGGSDTSRFLVAGAARSLWARTKQGMLAEAMPALREQLQGAQNVIIESNSVMRFIRPDLYLTVLDYETADFKSSALEFLDRADGVILHAAPEDTRPQWDKVSLKLIAGKPVFRVRPPEYVTSEIVDFVRSRLLASARLPVSTNS